MIIWGTGGDVVNLGVLDARQCDVCEKDRPFNIILQYRYFGFYWVFNCVTKKKYFLLCNVCNRGWEIDAGKLVLQLQKAPIPFMRRFGLLILIGVIVGLVFLSSIGALLSK